jgi:hypothetical protein
MKNVSDLEWDKYVQKVAKSMGDPILFSDGGKLAGKMTPIIKMSYNTTNVEDFITEYKRVEELYNEAVKRKEDSGANKRGSGRYIFSMYLHKRDWPGK